MKKDNPCIIRIYVFNRNAKMFHAIYECIQQMYLAFLIWENLHRRCILHYSHTSELPFKINLDLNVDFRVFNNFMTLQKIHAKIFHYNFSAFFKCVYTHKYNIQIIFLYPRIFQESWRKAEQYKEYQKDWQRYRNCNYNNSLYENHTLNLTNANKIPQCLNSWEI